MNFPVLILAGGLATRLLPITKTIPKSLVDVAGKPFIIHQLEYLREQGVSHVVLCIGFLGEMIKSIVGDGSQFEIKISYSSDFPKLLGTGGAIKKALPLLDEIFFVLYGDSFLPIEINSVKKAFLKNSNPALMTIIKNENKWDKSNVSFIDNNLIKYDKENPEPHMTYIDYGLSILSKNVFKDYVDNTYFDLSKVYKSLSKNLVLTGYEVHERFYEIGSKQGLKDANNYFLNKGNTSDLC